MARGILMTFATLIHFDEGVVNPSWDISLRFAGALQKRTQSDFLAEPWRNVFNDLGCCFPPLGTPVRSLLQGKGWVEPLMHSTPVLSCDDTLVRQHILTIQRLMDRHGLTHPLQEKLKVVRQTEVAVAMLQRNVLDPIGKSLALTGLDHCDVFVLGVICGDHRPTTLKTGHGQHHIECLVEASLTHTSGHVQVPGRRGSHNVQGQPEVWNNPLGRMYA